MSGHGPAIAPADPGFVEAIYWYFKTCREGKLGVPDPTEMEELAPGVVIVRDAQGTIDIYYDSERWSCEYRDANRRGLPRNHRMRVASATSMGSQMTNLPYARAEVRRYIRPKQGDRWHPTPRSVAARPP